MSIRRAASATTAVLALALLTACVPGESPAPDPTLTPSSSPSPSVTPSATPTPTPTPSVIDFSIDCGVLVPSDVIYAFDPNFSLVGSVEPASGSVGAEAVAAGGMVCRWVQDTSGITLDISVAHLPAEVSTSLKNALVSSSNSVPTYGVEGYFRTVGAAGEAQAFPDPYWVTMVSEALYEPGDASGLMAAAISALG